MIWIPIVLLWALVVIGIILRGKLQKQVTEQRQAIEDLVEQVGELTGRQDRVVNKVNAIDSHLSKENEASEDTENMGFEVDITIP